MTLLPEAKFVTYCCWEESLRDQDEVTRLAREVQCWSQVARLVADHGISALLLPILTGLSASGAVPGEAVREVRERALIDVSRTLRLRAALADILRVAQGSGVPIIVLKGAVLASLLYDRPEARSYSDVDLLCKESDFQAVQDVILSLGYHTDEHAPLQHRHTGHETYFERHFLHPDGISHVELHVDSIKLGVKPVYGESVWARAIAVEADGNSTMALSMEDQVFMLSVHLHRHGFNRLIWFKDIDLLIRRFGQELDWGLVIDEAQAEGAKSSLWLTFRYLQQMLRTPIPDTVMRALQPSWFTRWAFAKIWHDSDVLNLRSLTKRRAVQFSMAESWRGTIPSLLLMGRKKEKVAMLLRKIRTHQ